MRRSDGSPPARTAASVTWPRIKAVTMDRIAHDRRCGQRSQSRSITGAYPAFAGRVFAIDENAE